MILEFCKNQSDQASFTTRTQPNVSKLRLSNKKKTFEQIIPEPMPEYKNIISRKQFNICKNDDLKLIVDYYKKFIVTQIFHDINSSV